MQKLILYTTQLQVFIQLQLLQEHSQLKNNVNEDYIKEIKKLNDEIIFSKNYDFGNLKNICKSYRAFTFNLLSLQTLFIVFRLLQDRRNHNARFNVGNRSNWLNFLQDEFTEFKKDTDEEGDYTGGRSIGLILKMIRCLSNVKWEWKSMSKTLLKVRK